MGEPPDFEIRPEGPHDPTIVIESRVHGRGRIAVLKAFGEVRRFIQSLEGAPDISGIWPITCEQQQCGAKYLFKGPDDFPLDTLYCTCGDVKCVVVEWE